MSYVPYVVLPNGMVVAVPHLALPNGNFALLPQEPEAAQQSAVQPLQAPGAPGAAQQSAVQPLQQARPPQHEQQPPRGRGRQRGRGDQRGRGRQRERGGQRGRGGQQGRGGQREDGAQGPQVPPPLPQGGNDRRPARHDPDEGFVFEIPEGASHYCLRIGRLGDRFGHGDSARFLWEILGVNPDGDDFNLDDVVVKFGISWTLTDDRLRGLPSEYNFPPGVTSNDFEIMWALPCEMATQAEMEEFLRTQERFTMAGVNYADMRCPLCSNINRRTGRPIQHGEFVFATTDAEVQTLRTIFRGVGPLGWRDEYSHQHALIRKHHGVVCRLCKAAGRSSFFSYPLRMENIRRHFEGTNMHQEDWPRYHSTVRNTTTERGYWANQVREARDANRPAVVVRRLQRIYTDLDREYAFQ